MNILVFSDKLPFYQSLYIYRHTLNVEIKLVQFIYYEWVGNIFQRLTV